MKKLIIILAVLLLLYLLVALFVLVFQKKFIFHPLKGKADPPEGFGIREVMLPSKDGELLHGWFMENDTAAPYVLFFHGNAGNVSTGAERMTLFHEMGLNVLMIDYRGYGASSGKILREEDLFTDAEAGMEYLLQVSGKDSREIMVWGWSLGGAAASYVAEKYAVAALFMESTFYSMAEIAQMRYPFLPMRGFFRFPFRSGERMARIHCPVLVIHSPDDRTIPYSHGQRLHRAAQQGRMITIRGGHGHGIYESRDLFDEAALAFVHSVHKNSDTIFDKQR